MQTVGFIGLGNLGTPMARNIQRAGFPIVVFDVVEGATRPLLEGGARFAAFEVSSVPGPPEGSVYIGGEVAAASEVILTRWSR